MIVVGIDPSLTGTGIATANQTTTVRGDGDRRLLLIYINVYEVCRVAAPDLAVIEDLPTHAHGAGKTGMAQGAVRVALIQLGIPYALVTAATLKKYATGKGNATKPDMRMALYQRTGVDLRDDNQVDAWWLRAMGMQHAGSPLLALPKTHLEAMTKVAWPDEMGAT